MTAVGTTSTRGKQFEMQIEQTVTAADLDWPWGAESQVEGVGWNSDYWRLPRVGWARVRTIIREEREVVDTLSAAEDQLSAYDAWYERRLHGLAEYLIGLDLGVNALVAALRAGRSLPFYSCNGGAFGVNHDAPHPAVFFFCKPQILLFVDAAARAADVALIPNLAGGISAYGRNVDAFINMAEQLCCQRDEITSVELPRPVRPSSRLEHTPANVEPDRQLCLL